MADTQRQTVYVTKYLLSEGITARQAEIDGTYATTRRAGPTEGSAMPQVFRIGVDAFLTREEALDNARKRRKGKIRDLRRQIRKLEAMEITCPD